MAKRELLLSMFEQISRQMYRQQSKQSLNSVQWAALRYFCRAGRHTRTVVGLAKYTGVTVGPASRTSASLVSRGFLQPVSNIADGRSKILNVTEAGREMLARDPAELVAAAFEELSDKQFEALAVTLNDVFVAVEGANNARQR